ncbi:hypothetical protein DENSPDRAFT_863694 [Dentipellis sp. KUC8613]|nr:hypothetical protein DENSPDRAFT_863694 [Dentipellis sp. KUC8613]
MRFTIAAVFSCLATAATAHFHLQYPPPRGPFVEDNEPTFCDNYVHAVDNRSVFPLSGGFFSLTSEHPKWTIGVLVSTKQDPTSFNDFNSDSNVTQFALPFVQSNGEGAFCFPLDLSHLNVSGLQDGANITLQFEFNGGDGNLFQCADLTLSNNFTVPSNVSCSNATSSGTSSSSSSAPSPSSGSSGNSGSSSAGTKVTVAGITGVLAAGVALGLSLL